jgi:predicted regulator of Ras-like GTPase activity (Roadblock/LC7/MglB family)
MFGFLKRLFSKPAGPEPVSVATAPTQAAMAAGPAQTAPAQAAPAAQTSARSADATVAAVAKPVADPEGVICLPLGPILAALPADLGGLVASPAGGNFFLPVRTATAQLGSGAVKIPFGELRQGSPPGTFYDNATQDRTPVALPLAQILCRLDLSLLARRAGQKGVAVPESVTSVFGQGRKLEAPVSAPVRAAEPQAPSSGQKPDATPASPQDAMDWLHAPVAPAPKVVRPLTPLSFPKPPPPEPGASRFTRLPTTVRLPSPGPEVPSPAESAPAVEREFVEARLSALSECWPAEVLKTIAECKLQEATVSLPMGRLEEGLKKGRVVFSWGDLCQWMQPPPPEQASAHGGVALELSLKVVAPLFMARRRPWAVPKQMTGAAEIAGHIPDLFGRTAGAAGTAVPVPATVPSAAAAPAGALDEIFGLPGRNEWTPAEICRRVCALEGVTGSALAMSDGLVVAAQLPRGLSGETMAAFLPQIFGHASKSAGEMQLGPLTGVVLTAGLGRCAIYKAGKLYLAVLGDAGTALPEATLARIAVEIGKRNP